MPERLNTARVQRAKKPSQMIGLNPSLLPKPSELNLPKYSVRAQSNKTPRKDPLAMTKIPTIHSTSTGRWYPDTQSDRDDKYTNDT